MASFASFLPMAPETGRQQGTYMVDWKAHESPAPPASWGSQNKSKQVADAPLMPSGEGRRRPTVAFVMKRAGL
jgi:hypothetical protein